MAITEGEDGNNRSSAIPCRFSGRIPRHREVGASEFAPSILQSLGLLNFGVKGVPQVRAHRCRKHPYSEKRERGDRAEEGCKQRGHFKPVFDSCPRETRMAMSHRNPRTVLRETRARILLTVEPVPLRVVVVPGSLRGGFVRMRRGFVSRARIIEPHFFLAPDALCTRCPRWGIPALDEPCAGQPLH